MAIGTPALYLLQEMIPGFDIHSMYKIAISASVTYLLKNFFTKPDTKLYSEEIGGGGIQNPKHQSHEIFSKRDNLLTSYFTYGSKFFVYCSALVRI